MALARFTLTRALLLLVAAASGALASDGWQTGRATFYGTDGWSIHKGSCGLGYQYKSISTGWDVAAVADASPEFSGSCGRCYEVKCDPRKVEDGYGNHYDRTHACKAGSASLVIRVVDACPCIYPGNSYSNKRWCCGDHKSAEGTHFDMSLWAFEKLADKSNGMIGLQWRRVSCDTRPAHEAPEPSHPSPMPKSEQPSAMGYPGSADSPGSASALAEEKLVVRFDDAGAEQGAVRPFKSFDEGASVQVVTRGDLLSERGGGDAFAAASASAEPSDTSASAASTDNGCTDTAPKGKTCKKVKGQCDQPWMMAGNYCRATCKRCVMEQGSGSSFSAAAGGASRAEASSTASSSSSGGSSSSFASASSSGGSASASASSG